MDRRDEIIRTLKLGSIVKAHEIVVAGAKHDARWLLRQGLNARILVELGYSLQALQRLGYSQDLLVELGVIAAKAPTAPSQPIPTRAGDDEEIQVNVRELIDAGYKADHLKQMSVNIHHCKRAGLTASELVNLGYKVEEIAPICSATELRRAGFRPTELRRFFNGHDLRSAGYSADEMRLAGYSIKDLLAYGYNENHVRSAGYSNNELMAAGLSKYVKDDRGR